MREFSVPPVRAMRDDANLTDEIWEAAEERPDCVLFRRRDAAQGWRDVSAVTFREEVEALARGLVAAGVQAGDRVALMSRTRYEWTLVDYAIWAAGAATVPVYETSGPEQVAWVLADSGAVACVVETAAHEEVVAGVRRQLPALRDIWRIDGDGLAALRSAGERATALDVADRRAATTADDIATVIYTSGTTGRPKGCVLTHRNLYTDVTNALPGLRAIVHEGASTLLFLPLAHSLARIVQLGMVHARATLGHTADIANLLADLRSFQPTFVLTVPRVLEKVYNTAKQQAHAAGGGARFDRAERVATAYSQALDAGGPGPLLQVRHTLYDRLVYRSLRAALGGRCRYAISGGAALGPRLTHFFRGIGVTVYEGYGLTETSPVSTLNLPHAHRIGTVGRPLPGVTVRVADDGEVLVKGDHVFGGYWNDAAATAGILTAEGFLHTGDAGELDDAGYLRITGRKKEMIVTASGSNVAPAALENRIRAHPLVSQCVVVGDQRPFVAALVTIDEAALPKWRDEHGKRAGGADTDPRRDPDLVAVVQAAVDEANKTVSQAESIRMFRILPRDFSPETGEMTPSLTVRRSVVMKEYADEIADIYR